MDYGGMYYDIDGQPISFLRYVELRADPVYFRVALDVFDEGDVEEEVHVSTVWLGLDHEYFGGLPVIFETMVFGGPLDGDQWRYTTLAGARAGHQEVVTLVRHERELASQPQEPST